MHSSIMLLRFGSLATLPLLVTAIGVTGPLTFTKTIQPLAHQNVIIEWTGGVPPYNLFVAMALTPHADIRNAVIYLNPPTIERIAANTTGIIAPYFVNQPSGVRIQFQLSDASQTNAYQTTSVAGATHSNTNLILGVVFGCVCGIIAGLGVWAHIRRRRRKNLVLLQPETSFSSTAAMVPMSAMPPTPTIVVHADDALYHNNPPPPAYAEHAPGRTWG
jgi:hypothetical protein